MDDRTKKVREETRRLTADVIPDALGSVFDQVKTWVRHDHVGPLGGISSQVIAAVEVDGHVVPITVAVYSDDRIADLLDTVLTEEQQDDELRKRLGWRT